jgi:hypothetical protein
MGLNGSVRSVEAEKWQRRRLCEHRGPPIPNLANPAASDHPFRWTEAEGGKNVKYVLRLFCEWGGGCLWPGNEAAYEDFGLGPYDLHDPCPLPLTSGLLRECWELATWHDKSLNWDYPPDPGPWRQAECDRFNAAVANLLARIRTQLGPEFEVTDHQNGCFEDPDLDAYQADPKGFRRKEP